MPGRPSLVQFVLLFLATTVFPGAVHSQTASLTAVTDAPYGVNPHYMRLGAPITFSGRILPADATGTLTLTVDNVPTQTVPLVHQSLSDYVALGDSITYGAYIADPAQRYPTILAQSLNLNLLNVAVPGYDSCDVMPTEALPYSIGNNRSTNPLYSLLIGTNDLAIYGIGAHKQLFNLCHQAALTWLGVPRPNKILIGDAAATTTAGAWTGAAFNTLSTNTPGSTLRFSLTTAGSPAYLWYSIQTAASGSFTVSVDGGTPTSLTPTGASGLGVATSSYALLRIPVTAGTHTFDIADQTGTVTILGMGSPPIAAGPTILAGDVPNQINGDTSGIAAYTADIQANIALLQGDGLDIRFVRTEQAMLATPAEMVDSKHPNALGLSELAAAFGAAISPSAPVADSIAVSAASFTTTSLPLGAHNIDILYSGDTRYSPTDAGNFTVVIYDGASTVALTSDSAIYPVQSPIVLTASFAQPNASGLVNFFDEGGPIGSAWLNQPTTGQAQLTLPSLPAGVHTLTAQYLGNVYYAASTSAPISITVSGSYTTTSLTAPATRYLAAQPIPLTATVAPASATGTITFSDGSATLGQAPLVSGSATLTTATLAPGIHSLTATYGGNATQDSSASPTLGVEIDLNSTAIALSTSPATAAYAAPLTVNASVAPATATGTVTFLDGSQPLGQVTLVNGSATLIVSTLTPGTHTLNATYSGDTNDLASTTSITTQITLAPTTVTLAAIPATSIFGTPISLAASVNRLAATGVITFWDGNANLGQIPLANGAATLTIATLNPGRHIFTATYSGDSLRAPSTSAAVADTITAIPATIALAALPAIVDAGNPIALSATLSPATATGTVVFRDATLGVLGQSTVANGTAALTLANPAVGVYSILATYDGDSDDTAATSSPVTTQVVLNPTTTTLAASPGTATLATPITLTASVAPRTATGSIMFLDGATPIGSALVTQGSATFLAANLTPGNHTLHATYSGDTLNAASAAAPIAETITLAPSTTTLSFAQNPIIASGQIIANVAVANATTNPTGTVSIRSGSTLLGTGTLGNGSGGLAYVTLSAPTSTLGIGTFPLTALYAGDSGGQPSSSSASITIAAIPTTSTLTLSATQIPIQGSITLSAAISANATGTITFLSNGTPLATATVSPAGAAAYSFTPPSTGTYILTAAYTPTGLYAPSSSAALSLTVTAPLSAVLNPTSVNATAGATQTATLTLTPLSGFNGPIQAACKGSVAYVTCTVAPPATLAGTVSTPVQIKVSGTSAELSFPSSRRVATAALALLLPLLIRRKARLPLALVFAALWIAGCAEGGDFNAVPPGAENIIVTVTAANTTATTSLTVNIAN